ncbi:MAG TPA: right-handed parallel beta-helix repeat-containing protein [Clostridia bacterium]|nr:right-handed parallel beta-helix repeat-containing protein [Clostridia bacterium]
MTIKKTDKIQPALDKVGTNLPYSELHCSSGEYPVTSLLRMNTGTKITCDAGVTWKLRDNVSPSIFGEQIAILGQKTTTISGLDISGINYDGNYDNQDITPNDHGLGYGNFIGLSNCINSKFHDLSGGYNEGDFFRLVSCSNLEISSNTGEEGGHDWLHMNKCYNIKIHDNQIRMRSNNVMRIRWSNGIEFYNNECIGTTDAYAPGIQCENIDTGAISFNIQIHNNTFKNIFGPAIWLVAGDKSKTAKDVTIENNLFVNCGLMPESNAISGVGGAVIDGYTNVKIQKNTFDRCSGYSIMFGPYLRGSTFTKLTATVNQNIITNSVASCHEGVCTGGGIVDLTGGRYTISASGNCFFNNEGANLYKVTDSKAILADPLYIGNGDYHLKSKAGHYTENGFALDKVNSPAIFEKYELGAYSGTKECSIYNTPYVHLSPSEIVGNNSAVIILCNSPDDAKTLGLALEEWSLWDDGKMIIYSPETKSNILN